MSTNETKNTNSKANVNQLTSKVNETKSVTMPDGIKTADTDKGKADQAFNCLCNGVIDPKQLLVFGEANLKTALQAIKAFKDHAEQQKKAETNKLANIDKLLTEYNIIQIMPTLEEVRLMTHAQSTSTNARYYQLMMRSNGASFEELEKCRQAEEVRTGKKLDGYTGLKSNMKNTLKKHGVTIVNLPNGNQKLTTL